MASRNEPTKPRFISTFVPVNDQEPSSSGTLHWPQDEFENVFVPSNNAQMTGASPPLVSTRRNFLDVPCSFDDDTPSSSKPSPSEIAQYLVSEINELAELMRHLKGAVANVFAILSCQRKAIISEYEEELERRIRYLVSLKLKEEFKKHGLISEACVALFELNLDVEHLTKSTSDAVYFILMWRGDEAWVELVLEWLLERVKQVGTPNEWKILVFHLLDEWIFFYQDLERVEKIEILAPFILDMYSFCYETTHSTILKEMMEGLLMEWERKEIFSAEILQGFKNTKYVVKTMKETELEFFKEEKENLEKEKRAKLRELQRKYDVHILRFKSEFDELKKEFEDYKRDLKHFSKCL